MEGRKKKGPWVKSRISIETNRLEWFDMVWFGIVWDTLRLFSLSLSLSLSHDRSLRRFTLLLTRTKLNITTGPVDVQSNLKTSFESRWDLIG